MTGYARAGIHSPCAADEMLRVMDSGFTRYARVPEMTAEISED
jgi:hypothetical protein